MNISHKIKVVLINIVIVLVLLFLIEGLLSYSIVGHAFFTQRIAERQHTEYDEELGWINVPNVFIADMYSTEDHFTTNSQRYRNASDFSQEVPAGKVRIVCSGDSFTLGFGVDDNHTWCQQLTTMDNRLETVNMGQGGYGIDQAYLWYRRDQSKLDHDVVLFAFIVDDFARMESDTFMGHGKPYLTVRDGELIQKNYPVPRRSYDASWLTANLHMLQQLRTVSLLTQAVATFLPGDDRSFVTKNHRHTDDVVAKIFSELQQISLDNQRLAILVYLPTLGDYKGTTPLKWRRLVLAESRKHGYLFVDVFEEMRTLPPHVVKKMFRGGGHYSDDGNRYVAKVLYKKLREITVLSDKLQQ
jgi:hypothetical protein